MTTHLTPRPLPDAPPPHEACPADLEVIKMECAEWLKSIHAEGHFHRIFDHLPGLFFFTKDARGRFMVVSANFPRHYGLADEQSILGLNDLDLTPREMAMAYIRDDQELLSGHKPIIQRIELWFDDQGLPDWFFVTKMPLYGSSKAQIVGLMGVLRKAAEHEMQIPLLQTVARAIDYMRKNYAQPLTIAEVARKGGISARHLHRRFHESFGFSPQEFLIRTRVRAAMELLQKTNIGACEIARQCGFKHPSAFAEHFRQRTGLSPTAWRKRITSSTTESPR